jgi:hypothetical protein
MTKSVGMANFWVLDVVRLEFINKFLSEIFTLSRKFPDKVLELGPNMERSIKFKRELHHLLAPYKEIHKELENKKKYPSKAISSLQTLGPSNQRNA